MSVPGGPRRAGPPLGLHLIGNELDEQIVINAGLAHRAGAGFTHGRRNGGEGWRIPRALSHRNAFVLGPARRSSGLIVLLREEGLGFESKHSPGKQMWLMPDYRIKGETGEWEVVVGLEVHAQITATASKLFSGAATAFGAEPNTQVSLVDAAMPGMLPVPNRECIRQAVRTGMALDAKINRVEPLRPQELFLCRSAAGLSDQPALPSAGRRGRSRDPARREGRERRKHDRHRAHPRRAGRGQADARPAPDDELRRPQPLGRRADGDRVAARHAFAAEAGAYLRKLRSILRYVGSCDGNMEEGSMRADVNVSVRKPGGELGTRTETKNVNSVRFVMAVVEHEAKRQVELIEGGGAVAQETRLYDPDKGVTRSLRSKEDAHDYRYFPDPDLLPLELDEAFLEECKARCPSCPTPSASATKRSASRPTMRAC